MKKIISFFLALCMALTLLPTVVFAADVEGVAPIVADFTKTSKGNNLSFDAVVTDGFSIVAEKSSTKGLAAAWNGVGLQFNTYQYAGNLTTWPADKSAKNQMFTVNVVAEKSGYYDPEFIYEAYYKGANFAIYINGQYAGVVDSYDEATTKGVAHTAKLNSVFLDEGANEVSFRCVGKTKSGGSWLILDKLTLTYCGDSFAPVTFSNDIASSIKAGTPVEFTVSAAISEKLIRFYATYNEAGTAIDNPQGTVTVASEQGAVALAEQTATAANGTFNATAGGKAKLTASTTINGTAYSKDFETTVSAPIVADFAATKLSTNNSFEGATTSGFTIDVEKSTKLGARVALDGKGLQFDSYLYSQSTTAWPAAGKTNYNFMLTIKVDAAEAGYYSPELIFEAYKKGGEYTIYVNDQCAGWINSYDVSQDKGVEHTARLNAVYLNAGENEISFKNTKQHRAGGTWLILDKLTLTPCDEVPAPVGFVSTIPSEVNKDESVEFTVKPVMSDESNVYFGPYTNAGDKNTEMPVELTVTSGNGKVENIAITSEGISGTFTATGKGTVAIKASTTINGTTYADNFNVTVKSDEDEEIVLPTTITMSVSTDAAYAGNLVVNGAAQAGATQIYNAITVGDDVTVVANPIDGKIFRGWLRGGENGTLVCLDSTYTFTAATNVPLFAKYTDAPTVGENSKEYYDWNGEFLAFDSYNGSSLSKYGFRFKEWLESAGKSVTRYVANYEADNTYTITYPTNATASPNNTTDANVAHDTLVTVTNTAPVSWYSNGKLAAYGTTYSFYATGDATITISDEVQAGPIVKLDNPSGDTYILEYNANGANVVEKGIVIGNSATTVTSCLYKVISQRNTDSGKLMTNNDTGYTTVRGYVIYNDGGTYRVAYADIAE